MPKSNSESDFGGSITSDDNSDVDVGPSSHLPTHPSMPEGNIASSPRFTSLLDGQPNSPTRSTSGDQSHRPTPATTVTANSQPPATILKGAARFRASAYKIIQMHRTSSFMGAFRGAGAEPGIDPRRASAFATYGHLKEKCSIQVVDYSSIRSNFQTFDNQGFIDFLREHGTTREHSAKVRWIAIGGISWDVISTLALTYNLHPLCLEDVLHSRGHLRSKADYFSRHLFIRALCHSLGESDVIDNPDDASPATLGITTLHRSTSPSEIRKSRSSNYVEYDEKDAGYEAGEDADSSKTLGIFHRRKRNRTSRRQTSAELEAGPMPQSGQLSRSATADTAEAIATIGHLKAGQRVNVLRRKLFMFLFRDGTLISLHQANTPDFAEPIMNRLRTRDTVLRSTADPSLLLESILDLVVDQAVEIVEEYQKMLLKLEHSILLKPKMKSVRHLHILSGDLAQNKRTLEPLKALVYGLRRYDLDRCIAVAASSAEDVSQGDTASGKTVGYMSHKSKVYLADVHDHIEYILSSLDMFAGTSENLINYTFNMAGHETNEVMRRLTLATIIFLPLTLLTGYFGMNFDPMWSVNNNSDAFFWKIAVPVMAVVIPLFLWGDLVRMKHFFEKKAEIRRSRSTR